MSTKGWTVRDNYSALAVGMIWLMAATVEHAHAEAWVPLPNAQLNAVFVEQGAVLAGYHSVIMDPLSVWFGESDSTEAERDAYLAAFRAAYATAFAESLPRQGLALVDEAGPGVLRLHVEVVDLMVNEHGEEQLRWAERFSFPTAPERLTLVAELSDASTGAVLVRVADLGRPGDGVDVWSSVHESFEGWAITLAGVVSDHGRGLSVAAR